MRQGRLLMKIESGEIAAQAYQAQAAYNNAKLQFDRIKTLFDEKAATQMEMDQATLGLESAKAGLNAAKAMESYTTITAPISGQIVEKKINLGEMALPGQPILKIEDNRNLQARSDREGAGPPVRAAGPGRDGQDRCAAGQGDQGPRGAGRAGLGYQDPFVHREDRYSRATTA